METDQGQGSFKLLKSFLGTIAGGLSSLASLPFGKRKKPESPLLEGASPHSQAGIDESGDDLSKLYPDTELSETRKRARLSLDEVFEDMVEYSNGKEGECLHGKGLEASSEVVLGDTSGEFERASIQLADVQYDAEKMVDDFDVTTFSSEGVAHVSHGEIGTQHTPNASLGVGVSGQDEALPAVEEDSDDFLASFRRTLTARKAKEQKRVQDLLMEESPRKKVRFGESPLTENQPSESPVGQSRDTPSTEGSTRTKRKRANLGEEKNEKKLRALTINEEPIRPEGRTTTVGMTSILTRKRGRAEDVKTETEDVKLKKEKTSKKSKNSARGDKLADWQSARVVLKEERVAKDSIAHNMKEFNGNRLHVTAAHTGVVRETVPAPVADTWSIFVSNTPTDVKDEELFALFSVIGSLKLDVAAVRVIRDPQTGLGKGTAHVFFKTETDLGRVLSSRHTFNLRGRVLRVSHRSKQTRLTKRSLNSETAEGISQQKRVKLSSSDGNETAAKELMQEKEKMLTRSRRAGTEDADKEHIDVLISSTHVYATRQVAASLGSREDLEESPEAKRKRVEKRQRGISRSKKIRRT